MAIRPSASACRSSPAVDEPIVWPDPTNGNPKSETVKSGKLPAWRTAAEDVIDWTIDCPSIFLSKADVKQLYAERGTRVQRPLKPKTMARIFKGLVRFVIESPDPFIIPVTHSGDLRSHSAREPVRTQTGAKRGEHALVTPYLVPRYGERDGQQPRSLSAAVPLPVVVPTGNGATLIAPHLMMMRNSEKPFNEADKPTHTITAGGASPALIAAHLSRQFGQSIGSAADHPVGSVTAGGAGKTALVAAFLAQHNYEEPGHDAREPASTVVSKVGPQAVVSAGLLDLKGSARRGGPITAPTPAVTAQGGHLAEVRAFLIKFYKTGGQHQDARDPLHTLTAKARIGAVTVHGEDYQIVDIGMRMLTARERFNAHSFPADYKIDIMVPRTVKGKTVMKPITAEEQGRMVGNSVPCRWVKAVVAANYRPRSAIDRKPSRSSKEFTLEAAE